MTSFVSLGSGHEPAIRSVPNADQGTLVLTSVQGLRVLAASLVLIGHAQGTAVGFATQNGLPFTPPFRSWPGGFGVDLFFLISGFIMVVSSGQFFGSVSGAKAFFVRRIIRIVPLYYAATLAYLPFFLHGRHDPFGKIFGIIASFLFLPYPTYGFDGDNVFPVLSLGWTLNYEMFFYLVFTAFLPLPRAFAIAAGLLAMGAGVLSGLFLPFSLPFKFWLQPIVLEFCLGMIVAVLWSRFYTLLARHLPWSREIGIGLICASLVFVFSDPLSLMRKTSFDSTPNDFVRFLGWGVPAATVMVGALLLEWRDKSTVSRMLRRAGDCSYSLYLIHPFCLIVLLKIAYTSGLMHVSMPWILLLGALTSAYVAAYFVYFWLERPITQRLRRLVN